LGSILGAIEARIERIPKRAELIRIDLGEHATILVDLAAGTVSAEASQQVIPTTTLSTSPRFMARVMNGAKEPRGALLLGWIRCTGGVEGGMRLCDELAGRRFSRQDHFTDLPLPAPTTDRELARNQLRDFGYCIVADALSPEELARLRKRLDDQAAAEHASGLEYLEGGRGASKDRRGYRGDDESVDEASAKAIAPNQRVWLLHNKGDAFLDLLENPLISEFIPDYLDEDHPQVSQFSSNIVGPGGEAQFLHQDQHAMQPATSFPLGINALICLDDFTEANGATRVIPGSHIAERGLAPDNIYTIKGTVPALAPAGSAILVDTRLWHGSGENRTDERRRAIVLLTQRSWTRTVNNGVLSVHPSVLEKMCDRMKAMFGHRVTGGLGSIQTEPEGTIVGWNPDQLILEMSADANAAGA
jgi:ectoine hydroxylase-related dioxygenase (phytanoyl-CoA dioxygenase family)